VHRDATTNVCLFVKGSKDEVQLPQRKRVKVEQEAEEVSTVTSGKVVVSAMGSARIVGSNQPVADKTCHKVLDKTRTARTTKKGGAWSKKLSSVRSDSINIAAVRQGKARQQREETVHKASKSLKHSESQQPPRKKKRSVYSV